MPQLPFTLNCNFIYFIYLNNVFLSLILFPTYEQLRMVHRFDIFSQYIASTKIILQIKYVSDEHAPHTTHFAQVESLTKVKFYSLILRIYFAHGLYIGNAYT